MYKFDEDTKCGWNPDAQKSSLRIFNMVGFSPQNISPKLNRAIRRAYYKYLFLETLSKLKTFVLNLPLFKHYGKN